MIANDFILQTRAELQERKEFWSNEELFIKLQRCYVSLQFDMPYFISSEEVLIKQGDSEGYIKFTPVKDISLKIQTLKYRYIDIDNLYINEDLYRYSFIDKRVVFNLPFKTDSVIQVVYKYEENLINKNCDIAIPVNWRKALRFLFMSEIHEKPRLNTKERNLSAYYLKRYEEEIMRLKTKKQTRVRNIKSKYQKV